MTARDKRDKRPRPALWIGLGWSELAAHPLEAWKRFFLVSFSYTWFLLKGF